MSKGLENTVMPVVSIGNYVAASIAAAAQRPLRQARMAD
jgi:hypothetical protein